MSSKLATIEKLRAHLSQVAPMRPSQPHVATCIPALDAEIGGWPCPGIVSIHGAIGTGRIGIILNTMQTLTQNERVVAIVDPLGWLYPPGLPGIDLQKLMLVRCGSARAGWAAAQLASSGAIPMVVLLDPTSLGANAHRFLQATEAGQSTLFVLTEKPDHRLNASIRIQTLDNRKLKIERGAPHQPVITW